MCSFNLGTRTLHPALNDALHLCILYICIPTVYFKVDIFLFISCISISLTCTRLPTMTLAGPTSECISLGLGRLVTQVWGHISTLTGCRVPSRNRFLVSDRWMPPSGVLGRWLCGTRARQYSPTEWMESTACSTRDIHWKLWKTVLLGGGTVRR